MLIEHCDNCGCCAEAFGIGRYPAKGMCPDCVSKYMKKEIKMSKKEEKREYYVCCEGDFNKYNTFTLSEALAEISGLIEDGEYETGDIFLCKNVPYKVNITTKVEIKR